VTGWLAVPPVALAYTPGPHQAAAALVVIGPDALAHTLGFLTVLTVGGGLAVAAVAEQAIGAVR
jgi:hypothetical protein